MGSIDDYVYMVKPHNDIPLIVQTPGYSEFCMPDHPRRFEVDPVDFGLINTEMSVRICIAMAKMMGAYHIRMLCFDSMVRQDYGYYNAITRRVGNVPINSGYYGYVAPLAYKDLEDIPNEFILPEEC